MDKKSAQVICTEIANGKCHDFRIYKESGVKIRESIKIVTDTGYLGLNKFHSNTDMPKKRSKKHPLSNEDKQKNQEISSLRVLNEHVIGKLKRFKILSDKYRNRRKRFGLRFNLISGIYNYELINFR